MVTTTNTPMGEKVRAAKPAPKFMWRREDIDRDTMRLHCERVPDPRTVVEIRKGWNVGTEDHLQWLHQHWCLSVDLIPMPTSILVRFARASIEFERVVYVNGRVKTSGNDIVREDCVLWLAGPPPVWPFK